MCIINSNATPCEGVLAPIQARDVSDISWCPLSTCSVHNEVLYGDEYRWDRCYDDVPQTMSAACAAHFVNEACFYECDVHVGKWRHHETCMDDDGEENSWQIHGMPIKASECNQFYQDCKNDLFCVSAESKSFFALPTCNHDTDCQTFGDIYADGKEMCELLWDNSFTYESNEANAYTWSFAEGEANPNNGILPSKAFPEQCAGFDIDPTDCVSDVQQLNQKLIKVEAELTHEQVRALPPRQPQPACMCGGGLMDRCWDDGVFAGGDCLAPGKDGERPRPIHGYRCRSAGGGLHQHAVGRVGDVRHHAGHHQAQLPEPRRCAGACDTPTCSDPASANASRLGVSCTV